MSFDPNYIVSAFNGEDTSFAYSGELVRINVKEIGGLRLVSGEVAACDPFICQDPRPFTRTVEPGTYPVRLAIAQIESDRRIAFAGVFFSELSAVNWEMAVLPGQEVADLEPGYEFVYPVDSGTGCFGDLRAMKQMDSQMGKGDFSMNIIRLMDQTYIHTRSWAEITPEPEGGNVFLFSSGYGDGGYPSYFGIDAQGVACCLVTDFYILGKKQPEDEAPN